MTGLDRRDESAGVVVGGDHNVRSLNGTNSIESYAVQDGRGIALQRCRSCAGLNTEAFCLSGGPGRVTVQSPGRAPSHGEWSHPMGFLWNCIIMRTRMSRSMLSASCSHIGCRPRIFPGLSKPKMSPRESSVQSLRLPASCPPPQPAKSPPAESSSNHVA